MKNRQNRNVNRREFLRKSAFHIALPLFLTRCASLISAPSVRWPVLPKPTYARYRDLDRGGMSLDFRSHCKILNLADALELKSKEERNIDEFFEPHYEGWSRDFFDTKVRNSARLNTSAKIECFGFYDNGILLTPDFEEELVRTDIIGLDGADMERNLHIDKGGKFEWVNALQKGDHALEAYAVIDGKECSSRRYVEIV